MFNGCSLVTLKKNRLLSTRMSNIYLKVTTEKGWHFQNFDFLGLKNLPSGQY